MLYPTAEEWAKWQIQEDAHRFFTLYWAELFDDDTPDTWQVRTCNIRTILGELIRAAEVAKSFDAYRNVIRSLLDEALSVIRRDSVIRQYYPFVGRYLEPWRNERISEAHVPQIQRLATVILGNLDEYWNNAVSLVRELLADVNGNKKSELYDASMCLAIEAASRGYPTEYIASVFESNLLVESDRLFVDRFNDMVASLSADPGEYACTFLPSGIGRAIKDVALPDDIKIQIGWPDNLIEGPHKQFHEHGDKNDLFIEFRVQAPDAIAARHVAGQRLTQLFAVLNLYGVQDEVALKVREALVQSPIGDYSLIGLSSARQRYLRNAKNRYQKGERLLRVHDRLGREDADQLMASLQYHRLALTATSDEARFVNLWVALESLCHGGEGSIIDRVCTRIAPCIAVTNIRKTIVNLAIYLRLLWTDDDVDDFMAIFPSSTKGKLKPQDLLDVLLQPDDGDEIKKLLELTARHPLICNRLYRVKTNLLNSRNSVAANLRGNRRNVEWQLRRIYRVRNEIVHTGSSTPLLRALIQHLHSYLSGTIQALVFDLDRQSNWSILDALEHRRQVFDDLVKLLTNENDQPISRRSLLNPDFCMQSQIDPHAWAAEVEPHED